MEDSGRVLVELARPLVEFLREHYDCNASIIIDFDKVKIVEDDFGVYFED